MITWTTAPLADGATLHAASLGDYRIEIIEQVHGVKWYAFKRVPPPDVRVVEFARHVALDLTVAQRAAVDAVMDDIMGETRRLTALLIETLTATEEQPHGTQAE